MIHQQLRLPRPIAQVAGAASQSLAYGGIRKTTDQLIGTLQAAWVPITTYQANVVPSPVGIVTNLANGTIQIPKAGVYTIVVNLEVTYTSDNNSSRTAAMRIFNVTDGIAIPDSEWELYAGAYTPGFSNGMSTMTPILQSNKVYRLEVSGGVDSFANFTVKQAVFSAYSLGAV